MIVHIGFAVAIALALNIGANNAGIAFGPAVGAGARRKLTAVILIALFYVLGAVTIGPRVVTTIGYQLFSAPISPYALLVVAPTTTLVVLILANILRVPISTTHAAVASLAGIALVLEAANVQRVRWVLLWWAVTPLVSLLVTYPIARLVANREFGPRAKRIAGVLLTLSGAYVAFAVGANNAANAAGALAAAGVLKPLAGAALAGGAMALGALFWGGRVIDTVAHDITPLTHVRALVVGVVSASITIAASWVGVPISLTLVVATSIIGFSLATVGAKGTVENSNVRRIVAMWTASPVVAFGTTYGLAAVLR